MSLGQTTRMSAQRCSELLGGGELSIRWLSGLGVRDPAKGMADLRDLAERDPPPSVLVELIAQLEVLLPRCSDASMALTNLERFVRSSSSPVETLEILAKTPRTTEILLQILSTSQTFSELMIRNPGLLAWLRGRAERRDRETLIHDLSEGMSRVEGEDAQKLVLREFRQREILRIGYNDIVRDLPLELITLDLSHLADACAEVALRVAWRAAEAKYGLPVGPRSEPARFAAMAFGKLGGEELNYSSDIDLMFLYDTEGQTLGPRPVANSEFFARLSGQVVRLLSDHTAMGTAYRVDMRLRPEGDQGPLARSQAATLGYYETMGRTWERQALIKCRTIAGSRELGNEFLDAICPFIYRRYLSAAEIGEIKAMKRRIEQRTVSEGLDELEVKIGRGGIRDVEFVVQFLQLLHGGQHPEVRHANTLTAIDRLEQVGCLTAEERGIMEETYRFLRRLEHRLQTLFDLQTHTMPTAPEDRRALAVRMGYPQISPWEDRVGPTERFLADYRAKTEQNRRILNHLLHDAFRDDSGSVVEPVVDLVLDPAPSADLIAAALRPYPFRDHAIAYQNLMALAREEIPFLSRARCRHFLAAIAPRLLEALSRVPDPDMALTNLEKVSASLGAKAVLWELFSLNPPTLRLYVELCATSEFLSAILIGNPGMIDDLMDSLVFDRPQPASAIRSELAELCKGAEDLGPILLSFRNKEWVRIGTRDILAREPIREVLRELSDVAQAIVAEVAQWQWNQRVQRHGSPRRSRDSAPARWAIIAMGKLGGRELTYQSDLDLVFLAETQGQTRSSVSNERYFTQLAQKVLQQLAGHESVGPLYSVDARLRPHGSSGPLVVPPEAFAGYFQGEARAWERMALTRARVIHSTGGFGKEVEALIGEIVARPVDPAVLARQVLDMRERLEQTRAPNHIKRGVGGLIDIEFLVQFLILINSSCMPKRPVPNMWQALHALREARILARDEHADLVAAYSFLRTVESRLRIVRNQTGVELSDRREELERLVPRLDYACDDLPAKLEAFRVETSGHAARARALYLRYLEAATAQGKTALVDCEGPAL